MRTFFLSSIAGAALVTGGGWLRHRWNKTWIEATSSQWEQEGQKAGPPPKSGGPWQPLIIAGPENETPCHRRRPDLHSIDHANFALSVGTRIPRTQTIYGVPKRSSTSFLSIVASITSSSRRIL